MSNTSQLRLLLWKDYLVRKRKPITVGGIIWACITIISLVIVRFNVDPINNPTCQFKARALPSAGMLPFLQSFICTVNNECEELDKYEEIPAYSNARLQNYQSQFEPLFRNETVLEVIELLPNSAKLLALVTKVIDDPEIHQIARNGLKISDLFKNPETVKRILNDEVMLPYKNGDALLDSTIKIENILNVTMSKTEPSCYELFESILASQSIDSISRSADILCNVSKDKVKKIIFKIIYEINSKKYLQIIGDSLNKMSKTDTIHNLFEFLSSFIQLSDFQNFMPKELQLIRSTLNYNQRFKHNFSYIDINLVYRFVSIFESLFNETETYKSIVKTMKVLSEGFKSMEDVFEARVSQIDSDSNETNVLNNVIKISERLKSYTKDFHTILKGKHKFNDDGIEYFIKVVERIINTLPQNTVDEMMFLLTIFNDIITGARHNLAINLHMEEIMYNTSLRHPDGIKKIVQLGPSILSKTIDALADSERVQVLSRKIFHPGQMFCDSYKLQVFYKISKAEANKIKPIVCSPEWKDFISDIVESFGVNNISKTINKMASLVISKTLGKDVKPQFVHMKDVILNIYNFIKYIVTEVVNRSEKNGTINWKGLFNESDYEQISEIIKSKSNLTNIAMVTINTALAREVISTNSVLETYITPILVQITTVMTALNTQLDNIPFELLDKIKSNVVTLTEITLATLDDQNKILKVLTADHKALFCGMVRSCNVDKENCNERLINNDYVVLPANKDPFKMISLLCNISTAITDKLSNNVKEDVFLYTVKMMINNTDYGKGSTMNWNELISTIQMIYIKLERQFGFLFRIKDELHEDVWENVRNLMDKVLYDINYNQKDDQTIKLSIDSILYIMHIVDSKIFDLDQLSPWLDVKSKIDSFNSLMYITDNMINLFNAFIIRSDNYTIEELPVTSQYLSNVTKNFPHFIVDVVNYIASGNQNVDKIITIINAEPRWPCSRASMGEMLLLSDESMLVMKSIESLMCVNDDLKEEWSNFKHLDKIEALIKSNITTNHYTENLFLKTAKNFNSFIDDLQVLLKNFWNFNFKKSTDNDVNLATAWNHLVNVLFNQNNATIIFRNFVKTIDTLISSSDDAVIEIDSTVSVSKLWELAINCQVNKTKSDKYCRQLYWFASKHIIKYVAEAGQEIVSGLTEYSNELLEPGANLLQLIGFTKKTGPYIIYDKLPDFVDVLFNSFLDQEFMKQIYASLGRKFWDCEITMNKLSIPAQSRVSRQDINTITPYICPSLVHWVSIPMNENVLLDLFSKTQNIFYYVPITNYTASFEKLMENSEALKEKMLVISKKNTTYPVFTNDWIDKILNISQTVLIKNERNNTVLDSFHFINGMNMIYLSDITKTLRDYLKKAHALNDSEFIIEDSENLVLFIKLFEKRPSEMIDIFIYLITEELKSVSDVKEFDLINGIKRICKDELYSTPENIWLNSNLRLTKQLCKTNYEDYIKRFDDGKKNNIIENFAKALLNVTEYTNNTWKYNLDHIIGFHTQTPGEILKNMTQYARSLGLERFEKYLDMRIQHYNIMFSFINGYDWWDHVRKMYNGTYVSKFMDVVENSPLIIDDLVSKMAEIKIVRLIKDIKINDTKLLCQLQLSDYIPDKTGLISEYRNSLCDLNETALHSEILPLRIAAQVYKENFKDNSPLSDTILAEDIDKLEAHLIRLVKNGPQKALQPKWLTDDSVSKMSNITKELSTKTSKINIGFFIINNVVDGLTLFVKSSFSSVSSTLTPWIKQVNLQFIKRDEYTTLICELPDMNLTEIHTMLVEDFHWNLALSEILSGRNYTWIEMNKALNELLDHVRYYLNDANSINQEKLTKCLIKQSGMEVIDKISLYLTLGSNVMKLIRASIPHFREVKGFVSNPTVQYLSTVMPQTIPVVITLSKVILNETILRSEIDKLVKDVDNITFDYTNLSIDLNMVLKDDFKLSSRTIRDVRFDKNASKYFDIVMKYLDKEYIKNNIQKLQAEAFWSCEWLSRIILSIEKFLINAGQLVESLGVFDWNGIKNGHLNSTIDVALQMMQKDYSKYLASKLEGMFLEFKPIFSGFEIGTDLDNIIKGINSLGNLPDEFLSTVNLKFELEHTFKDWRDMKLEINNSTKLEMNVLDELEHGVLNLEPILMSNKEKVHITEYVCKPNLFMEVFTINAPMAQRRLSIKDIGVALCGLSNEENQIMAEIMFQKINFTTVSNIVMDFVIKQMLSTLDIPEEEGKIVISNIGKTSRLMPFFKEVIDNVTDVAKNEPLIQSLQSSSSISSLLAEPTFLSEAGVMMCGKPFQTNINRFYRVIAQAKDNIVKPDQKQLDALPTDYCRGLYKEILNMGGGKILWTYAKPLLMGKILYTPSNPDVQQIITHANESFNQVGKLTNLLDRFSYMFNSLDEIIEHKESLTTVQHLLKSESIKILFEKLSNGNVSTNLNVSELVNGFGDTEDMKELVIRISKMANCISLNRFVSVESEEELEKKALRLMEVNEFMAGIVFVKNDDKTIEYKIRMDIDNVPSTSRIKNRFWIPGPNGDFIENLRYFRGFIQLQDMIDKAIISINKDSRVKRSIDGSNMTDWSVYTQQMPYPCYAKDDFKTIVNESQALVIVFFFSMILVVASVVRHLVWERESGNTMLMCVMGMNRNYHTFSWFISSILEVIATMVALCIILKFGQVLPQSDAFLVLLVLFNFGVSIVMFCYMVTSFFKSASLGAVSAVIFYLICFLPYVIVLALESFLTFPEKILTSLFMSSGFCYGILLTSRFEVQGVGLQWSNFNVSPLPEDPITVMNTVFIILFDSILYFIIGYIINNLRFKQKIYLDNIKAESGPNESDIGVRIDKITKAYKNGNSTRMALNNVSIDLVKGHITTLLGHNGAGKTTLINILMGMIMPDYGKITINKPIEDNKKNVLNHIGLCPQSDVLIETLTSKEHLIYYAQLKTGSSYKQIKYDVESMVEIMGLGHLATEPVHRLSGGLRRRLCVGLAFISNPHLVVLDEPSSGVDPVARRDIWSLIVGLKQNRTILLTTHHLDEAELLSDTLVIMHKGKILTSGSPLALKHQYGDGYKLNVTYPLIVPHKNYIIGDAKLMGENEKNLSTDIIKIYDAKDNMNLNIEMCEMNKNIKELLNVVKENIGNANVKEVYGNTISINLPYLDDMLQQNNFIQLIQQLEKTKQTLKYDSMSMDCSNLEQVFLSICKKAEEDELLHKSDNNKNWSAEMGEMNTPSTSSGSSTSDTISNTDTKEVFDDSNCLTSLDKNQKLHGSIPQQLSALLLKRFLHYRRNYRLLIITLILPAVFVALAMGFSLIRPPADSENPINLTPALYNQFSAEFVSLPLDHIDNERTFSIINDILKKSVKDGNRTIEHWSKSNRFCECEEGVQVCNDYGNSSISTQNQMIVLPSNKHIVRWIVNTQDLYTEKRYGGWSSGKLNGSNDHKANFLVWYNNKGDHALPSYVNTLNNAILKRNSNMNITTYNHPLKLSVEQLSKSTLLQHIADVGIAVILSIGFSLVPAGACIYLVKERVSQEKRLQLLCGVSPLTYWISTLLWDVLVIIIATLISVCVFEIFALPVFVARENLPAICLLLLLYGFSCSSLTHILEKLFNDASLANMILFCFNVFIGVIGLTILLIIDVLSKSEYADNIRWNLHKVFMIFPQFALGDGLVEISKNTIQASVLMRFGMDTYISPLGWELMGVHYIALTLTTIAFFSINLAYEYHLLDSIINKLRKNNEIIMDADIEDCDVATERYRIELTTMKAHYNAALQINERDSKIDKMNMAVIKNDKSDVLQVLSLKKVYKGVIEDRVAVENMTFGVKNGQCFGLLGVNGAGKSTTFKMLTGELTPSGGQIYIDGKSVKHSELCNGSIAYCPQTDALDPLVTLREHLEFYCRLRGIKNKNKIIKQVLNEFDLTKYTHQQAETLSGGNKRKLCTAISLMGNSPIVLLDEPTSGMDPGARRNIGLAIKRAVRSGRCLLLSSHSLIECESLCQVAAVMSLGRFLALGPPNYLKHRYGGGYLVSVRLASPEQKGQLIQNMSEAFPQMKLQNSHYCTTQFLVPIMKHSNEVPIDGSKIVNTKLSDVFTGLSSISSRLNIIDYSINQSSLDQVFINFSHNQIGDNRQKGKIRHLKLSTLERQYSKNKDLNIPENGDENVYVTSF